MGTSSAKLVTITCGLIGLSGTKAEIRRKVFYKHRHTQSFQYNIEQNQGWDTAQKFKTTAVG